MESRETAASMLSSKAFTAPSSLFFEAICQRGATIDDTGAVQVEDMNATQRGGDD